MLGIVGILFHYKTNVVILVVVVVVVTWAWKWTSGRSGGGEELRFGFGLAADAVRKRFGGLSGSDSRLALLAGAAFVSAAALVLAGLLAAASCCCWSCCCCSVLLLLCSFCTVLRPPPFAHFPHFFFSSVKCSAIRNQWAPFLFRFAPFRFYSNGSRGGTEGAIFGPKSTAELLRNIQWRFRPCSPCVCECVSVWEIGRNDGAAAGQDTSLDIRLAQIHHSTILQFGVGDNNWRGDIQQGLICTVNEEEEEEEEESNCWWMISTASWTTSSSAKLHARHQQQPKFQLKLLLSSCCCRCCCCCCCCCLGNGALVCVHLLCVE